MNGLSNLSGAMRVLEIYVYCGFAVLTVYFIIQILKYIKVKKISSIISAIIIILYFGANMYFIIAGDNKFKYIDFIDRNVCWSFVFILLLLISKIE